MTKSEYEAPSFKRMTTIVKGAGECKPGSGDVGDCNSGSSAGGYCADPGNTAAGSCYSSGNGATGSCSAGVGVF